MSEQSAEPIPHDLAEAFRDAVFCYPDGEFSTARVSYRGQAELISGICERTKPFSNPLPKVIFDRLCSHMHHGHHGDEELKGVLANEPTYSMAACCLLKLIESHKLEDRRREQLRPTR